MAGTARKILFNTGVQVAAKVIVGLFAVVILKLLTTYLGKTGYGFYKSIFEFLALFAIVADLGLFTIGVREMSKDREKEAMVLGNLMSIRTIVIVLMAIVAVIAAIFMPAFQGNIGPIAVAMAGLATIFAILTGTISSALQVHLKMEWNSIASILGKLVTLGYMLFVIFVWFPHSCDVDSIQFLSSNGSCNISENNFLQLLVAAIIGNFVMAAVTFFATRKIVKVTYRFDFKFWKDVIWKALPYGIALVLNQVYFRIGSIMLLNMRGPDAVAIYTAPLTILEAAGIIPLYFMNSILPFLTRALQQKDGSHKKIIQYSFDFLMMTALPIVAGTIVLAYQFIAIVSTKEFLSRLSEGFYGSDIILQILIFALLFSFLNGLFGYMLVASNHQDKLLWRNLVGALITIVLTWLLIPILDERGAAIANVITEIYITVVSFWLAKRYVKFKLNLKTFWKICLSTAIMATTLYFAKDFVLNFFGVESLIKQVIAVTGLVGFGAAIYFGVMLLTRGLTPEMINMIRKRKGGASVASSAEVEDEIK
ncbi:oligosaccharide flippase family protein [Candidatus Peregrinibacteria bacterium]|nr:oligosaccharide flippase family protein [Candidatus Peregrinibacteria bacterium]